jgi:hypothetical protein
MARDFGYAYANIEAILRALRDERELERRGQE